MVTSRMKRAKVLAALLWATTLTSALAVPPGFNIQGRLTDSNGVNREGNYSMKFTLYDAATGGSSLWTRTYPALTVRNGNFQTVLGDVAGQPALSEIFATGDSRHLEIQVLSGPGVSSPELPLVPRQQLVSVPYAMRAATVDKADVISSTGPIVFQTGGAERCRITPTGQFGIGTSTPTFPLDVSGDINLSGNIRANGARAMILGGFYSVATSNPHGAISTVVNPLTGTRSCPAGFIDLLLFASGGFLNCSGACSNFEAHICVKF